MKLVSVCIPTYNRYNLLARAVRSALSQTYTDLEILISDNCSGDGSWHKTATLSTWDARISIQRHNTNIGWVQNINSMLLQARGDFVLILADDDELLPDMVSKTVGVLENKSSMGMVHTDGFDCLPDGKCSQRRPQTIPMLMAGPEALKKIMLNNNLLFSSVLVRSECYKKLGLFIDSCSADWEMWARIGASYDIGYVDEPLVKSYIHRSSNTSPVYRYEKDWLMLGNKILSYFPKSDQDYYRPLLLGEIGNGFCTLGKSALQQGEWRRFFDLMFVSYNYLPVSVWIENYLRLLLQSYSLIKKWKKIGSEIHDTFV